MVATSCSSMSNWSRVSGKRYPAAFYWPVFCEHRAEAVVKTSSTTKNFCRRFYGCPYYNGTKDSRCDFFSWVQEGMCAHSTEIAAKVKRKLLDAEVNLNRVEKTYRLVIFFLCLAMISAFFAGKMYV